MEVGNLPRSFFTIKVQPSLTNPGVVTVESKGGLPVEGEFSTLLGPPGSLSWEEDGGKERRYFLRPSPDNGNTWDSILSGTVRHPGMGMDEGDFLIAKVSMLSALSP